jgi:TetR/AcrR family transcriptional regulator, cholesterol catabolism regulator
MAIQDPRAAAGAAPTQRWERRYREALDAAATAFAEKGFLGASTGDIADRLGIRQGSLYYYFSSKETALSAVCELGTRNLIDQLREILASHAPATAKLRAAIANHLLPLRSPPDADYSRVFIRHRHELPDGARQKIAGLARTYQSLIEQLFTDGVASGAFRGSLDPKLATLALLGLCNSVISARTLPRSLSIDEIVEEYARIFIEGVNAAGT